MLPSLPVTHVLGASKGLLLSHGINCEQRTYTLRLVLRRSHVQNFIPAELRDSHEVFEWVKAMAIGLLLIRTSKPFAAVCSI